MADTNDDTTQGTQGDVIQNDDSTVQGDNSGTSGDDSTGDNTGNAQGEPKDNTDTNSNPPPVAVCSMCIHVGNVSGKIATGAQREMTIGEALRMLPKHPTNFKTLANARMLAENVKPALPTQVCLHTENMDIDPMTGNAICRPCTVFNRYGECTLFETAEEKDEPSEPSDDAQSDVPDAPSGDDTGEGDATGGDSGSTDGGDVIGGNNTSGDAGDDISDSTTGGDDTSGDAPSGSGGDNTGDNTGNTPTTGDDTSGSTDDSGASGGADDTANS